MDRQRTGGARPRTAQRRLQFQRRHPAQHRRLPRGGGKAGPSRLMDESFLFLFLKKKALSFLKKETKNFHPLGAKGPLCHRREEAGGVGQDGVVEIVAVVVQFAAGLRRSVADPYEGAGTLTEEPAEILAGHRRRQVAADGDAGLLAGL